jgi:hypothetical protein
MARNKLWIIYMALLVCLLSPNTYAATLLEPKEKSPISISLEVDFLTTGPRDSGTRALRVIFLVSEVYYSLAIEDVAYGLTEGDADTISHSYYLNGIDIASAAGQSSLTALNFRRWIKWNEFELEDNGTVFRIRYTPARKFEVNVVKGKGK